MHIDLVLLLRVNLKRVNLVSFEFLMANLKEVLNNKLSISQRKVPS